MDDSERQNLIHDNTEETNEGMIEEFDENSVDQIPHPNSGTVVACRVCDTHIPLASRTNNHVIKCSLCNEATPIRPAPAGKKYVRCPCNCLLICRASSTRIACPRNNCRRVITLGNRREQGGSAIYAPPGSCRIACVYCKEVFLFNILTNALATCPHCKKNSAVGNFAKKRFGVFFGVGAVLLILAMLFTLLTITSRSTAHIWVYGLWIFLYGAAAFAFFKAFSFWCMKTSTIIETLA